MNIPSNCFKYFGRLAAVLDRAECHTATKYITPKFVIRATRIVFNRKIDKRDRRMDIIFTAGEPNYHARKFIKLCERAGEPFPVRKVQLTKFPKRRAAK